MARLGRCGGKQRDHLRDRDAHRSIRVCSRQPVLHGALCKQPLDLAGQEAMKATVRNVPVAVALVLAMTIGCLRAGAQSSAPSESKRQAKRLLTPQYPELARKLNLSGSVRIEVTIAQDGTVKHTR